MNEPLPIVVYGRETCQDTALARERLAILGVEYENVDVEADAAAARRVEAWNGGNRVTPTIVFGAEACVIAEPSLDELDGAVVRAGYRVIPPVLRALPAEADAAAIPRRPPLLATGRPATLGTAPLALFFAHGGRCLACRSYANSLLAGREGLGEGRILVVLPASLDEARAWLEGEARLPGDGVVVDERGSWRREVDDTLARDLGPTKGGPLVVLVDYEGNARASSTAADAGGLVAPSEAHAWLRANGGGQIGR